MEKTPIQILLYHLNEAIKVNNQKAVTEQDKGRGVAYKDMKQFVEQLLPTEESFAKECFKAGMDYANPLTDVAHNFEQHYSQYKTPQQ